MLKTGSICLKHGTWKVNCFIFAAVVVIIVVPFHYHSLQLILMITFCLVVKQNECKWTQRHIYNTERECVECVEWIVSDSLKNPSCIWWTYIYANSSNNNNDVYLLNKCNDNNKCVFTRVWNNSCTIFLSSPYTHVIQNIYKTIISIYSFVDFAQFFSSHHPHRTVSLGLQTLLCGSSPAAHPTDPGPVYWFA